MKSATVKIQEALIKQRKAGHDSCKSLHESKWSLHRLKYYAEVIDKSINSVADVDFHLGFTECIKSIEDSSSMAASLEEAARIKAKLRKSGAA